MSELRQSAGAEQGPGGSPRDQDWQGQQPRTIWLRAVTIFDD